MNALDWFESLALERQNVEGVKLDIAALESKIEPKGPGYGPIGHGTGGDTMLGRAMISAKAAVLKDSLPRMERRLEAKLDYATQVLYGASGRGGLAKATCTDDADMLCFHYLQGEGWASVGRRYVPDHPNPTVWCRRNAERACAEIDKIGMDVLADT